MSDDSRHHHHHKKSKKHKRDRDERDSARDSDESRKSTESKKSSEKSSEKSGSVEVKDVGPALNVEPKLIKRVTNYLKNWNKDVRINYFRQQSTSMIFRPVSE